MQQFITGFVIAVLVLLPALIFFVRKKNSKSGNADSGLKEFEQLGRLTGELAHEIKNPLSIIKINLQLTAEDLKAALTSAGDLHNDITAKRALRKIDIIQSEADRLEQILDGFLRYIDRATPQLAKADINSLVSDMIDFYSPRCHRRSITIRQGLFAKPLICNIDAGMLKQVILNIFINAQQAMPQGGELIIRTDLLDENAVITISDTGTGIAPDRLPHIFDVYYSSRPKGSGLGLPTAKRIIESHKGSLTVDSEPGKGTAINIKLPLAIDNEA